MAAHPFFAHAHRRRLTTRVHKIRRICALVSSDTRTSTFIALSVFAPLKFSAMTCVTPLTDRKGVVCPPCSLTAPFKCILKRNGRSAEGGDGIISACGVEEKHRHSPGEDQGKSPRSRGKPTLLLNCNRFRFTYVKRNHRLLYSLQDTKSRWAVCKAPYSSRRYTFSCNGGNVEAAP